MPRGLLLALLLLVAAPLVLLGWLSANAVQASRRQARENLSSLLATQLFDANQEVCGQFDGYATQLNASLQSGTANVIETLRQMRRDAPIVRQGILVDADGLLLFPPARDLMGLDELEVGAALPAMIDARPRFRIEPAAATKGGSTLRSKSFEKAISQRQSTAPEWVDDWAWQPWFMGDGAQVIFWRGRDDGTSVGILLERSRWMADMIALLPDNPTVRRRDDRAEYPTIAMFDETNRMMYRWGDDSIDEENLLVQKTLSSPLSSWHLRLYSDVELVPRGGQWPIVLSLGGVGVVLLAVGAYVLTSVRRQIETAKSRVSFAGQVSHELRTPLTNIRLYTELAESDLEKVDSGETKEKLEKRLRVIDHESRRLQRLVSGVLEMIRPSSRPIGVRLQRVDVRELLEQIAEQFAPSFAAAEITFHLRCDSNESFNLDADVIEMVMVNLLSNVEKYVPAGGGCWVSCGLSDETLWIRVEDDGPGIKPGHAERVFRPFVRLDDSISAPSGTGIGLTIARRAAERHGAQLRLMKRSEHGGAGFELSVPVEATLKQ
ncbi:MAG: HAMP domain-containing sensor histidine kinase [Planctomycetota bacterium]